MRILLIGGGGELGRRVCQEFSNGGHSVSVVQRRQTQSPAPAGVRKIVAERSELGLAMNGSFDVAIDMVCATGADADVLSSAIAPHARRCIVLSSADVYRAFDIITGSDNGALEVTPIVEDAPIRSSRQPYHKEGLLFESYDKVTVEKTLMRTMRKPLAILRIPMLFGTRDNSRIAAHLREMIAGAGTITYDSHVADWHGGWSYIGNAAVWISSAAIDDRAAEGIYNVSDEQSHTYFEYIEAFSKAVGWAGRLVPSRSPLVEFTTVLNPAQGWNLSSVKLRDQLILGDRFSWDQAVLRTAGEAKHW